MKKHPLLSAIQLLSLCLLISSCGGSGSNDSGQSTAIDVTSETAHRPVRFSNYAARAPFTVDTGVTFYQDVPYGNETRKRLDILLPSPKAPTGLVIYIHGGGFQGGDKSVIYADNGIPFINELLANNIAFASINYYLLQNNEQAGIIKSLQDTKRALQFIKFYADTLNIRKDRIILFGNSAGAGSSLWLGFHDDMAEANAINKILRESTRVHGIIATSTQASYDINRWANDIFGEYLLSGFNNTQVLNILTIPYVLKLYGIDNLVELSNGSLNSYLADVDMLALLNPGDPEFYVSNTDVDNDIPSNFDELAHHPQHGVALYNKALMEDVPVKAALDPAGINNTEGESLLDFIRRKIAE